MAAARVPAVALALTSMLLCRAAAAQSVERPSFAQGDSWVYDLHEGGNLASPGNYDSVEMLTVVSIASPQSPTAPGYRMSRVSFGGSGSQTKETLYNITGDLNPYARENATARWQEAKWWRWPLEPGARWQFEIPMAAGKRVWEAQVRGWEEVEVPAGKFETIRVVYDMVKNPDPLLTWQVTVWYAPAVKFIVRKTDYGQYEATAPIRRDIRELKSYRLH